MAGGRPVRAVGPDMDNPGENLAQLPAVGWLGLPLSQLWYFTLDEAGTHLSGS